MSTTVVRYLRALKPSEHPEFRKFLKWQDERGSRAGMVPLYDAFMEEISEYGAKKVDMERVFREPARSRRKRNG